MDTDTFEIASPAVLSSAQPPKPTGPLNEPLCVFGRSMLMVIGFPDRFEVVNPVVTVVFWPVAVTPVTPSVCVPSARPVVSRVKLQPTLGQRDLPGNTTQTSGRLIPYVPFPYGT